jgi:hypothetical protein
MSQISDNSDRFEIEKRIASSARQLKWIANENCYGDVALTEFLHGWHDLAAYYVSHEDLSIGVDVVREYLYWTEKLLEVKFSVNTEATCRERVSEAEATLEYLLSEIIRYVDYRLYPEGR